MICKVCGNEIKGKYFQASVDRNLKASDEGDVVCSMDCARKYEEGLPHAGKPIQHWSRITGYYQNVSGWGGAKLQELKDRRKYGV